ALPEIEVAGPSHHEQPERVAFVAAWNPPAQYFCALPRLRAVFALGAGIDAFLRRPDLPTGVPLLKLGDAGMAAQMLEYALLGVLDWQRRTTEYAQLQRRGEWRVLPARQRSEVRVGVLGLGRIGAQVASGLAAMGYAVRGWSRTARSIEGVECSSGDDALAALL